MKNTKKRTTTGNPQVEEGFTKVANELQEALNKTAMGDHERRCLGVVYRNVYGWSDGRKNALLSLNEISRQTGIERRQVHRALCILEKRNMIEWKGSQIGPQKKYQNWTSLSPQGKTDIRNHGRLPYGGHPVSPSEDTLSPVGRTEMSPVRRTPHNKDTRDKASKASIKAKDVHTSSAERSDDGWDGPRFEDGKPDRRRPEIMTIIDTIKTAFDLPILDGTEEANRQAAWNLFRKVKKIFPAAADPDAASLQLITAVIFAAKDDPFWKNHVTSVVTLSNKFLQIGKSSIERVTGQSSGKRKTGFFQG